MKGEGESLPFSLAANLNKGYKELMKTYNDLYEAMGVMDRNGDSMDNPENEKKFFLGDGFYDATNTPFLFTTGDEGRSVMDQATLDFIAQHGLENIRVGTAYETWGIILFAGNPVPFKGVEGTIGRGACAIITDAPKVLVLLAEND